MIVEELIQNLTPTGTAVGVIGFLVIVYWIRRIQIERKISSLGTHAPIIPTYLPLGKLICLIFDIGLELFLELYIPCL